MIGRVERVDRVEGFSRNHLRRGYGGQEERKDRKGVGVGFAPSVYTLYAPCDLFLAWRTGDTGEQLLFSPASPVLPAEFHTGFSMVFAAKNAKGAKKLKTSDYAQQSFPKSRRFWYNTHCQKRERIWPHSSPTRTAAERPAG